MLDLVTKFIESGHSVYRSTKTIIFVTRSHESPYVTTAENIKFISPEKRETWNLPRLCEDLLNPKDESVDDSKYAMLTHNGIAWELTSAVHRRGNKTSSTGGQEQQRSQKLVSKKKRESYVDLKTMVKKLPQGQHIVTMERDPDVIRQNGGPGTMQIMLPPTGPLQHWCIIRVDVPGEGSVQCPDSNLSLKCGVLLQAAKLSTKEKSPVRIPIPVQVESDQILHRIWQLKFLNLVTLRS